MGEIFKGSFKMFIRTVFINLMSFFVVMSLIFISGDAVMLIIAQGFALGILISFVYPPMWDLGAADINMVKIGQKAEDKLKGLKIGVLGTIPSALVFLVIAFTKNGISANVSTALYKFLNASLYPILEFVFGESKKFADLKIWQLCVMALLLCVVPVTAHLGYHLGYKGFSISEKLTYKKIKK